MKICSVTEQTENFIYIDDIMISGLYLGGDTLGVERLVSEPGQGCLTVVSHCHSVTLLR